MSKTAPDRPQIDFDALGRQLLRGIRGNRSQAQINKRLGFEFNQVSRWETGRVEISWPDFLNFCSANRISVHSAFNKYYAANIDINNPAAVISFFKGNLRLNEFAKHLGVSRFTASRWLAGSTKPSLKQILMIIHLLTATLTLFLESLVSPQALPALTDLIRHESSLRKVIFTHPYVLAALSCFELDEFKKMHTWQRGFLAKRLAITADEEDMLINQLTAIKQIRKKGNTYEVSDMRIDIRNDFEGKNVLRKYWTSKALEMLHAIKKTTERSQFGFLTYAVSEEARERIRSAYLKFYQEVVAILDADRGPKTCVQTANFQILDLEEMKKELSKS